MIKVVIVEDNINDEQILREHLARFGRESGRVFSVFAYKSALDFFSVYKLDADIIFMDVKLPDIDGMEAARRLRKIDEKVVLVFVTSMAQYAVEGYSVNARDYILKPVKYHSFSIKMKMALKDVNRERDEFFIISVNDKSVRICVKDIEYVEVRAHRLTYHTDGGDYVVTDTLSNVEKHLSPFGFYRSNSCYLVNIARVEGIEDGCVVIGGEKLPVSRSRKKQFLKVIADYYGG